MCTVAAGRWCCQRDPRMGRSPRGVPQLLTFLIKSADLISDSAV